MLLGFHGLRDGRYDIEYCIVLQPLSFFASCKIVENGSSSKDSYGTEKLFRSPNINQAADFLKVLCSLRLRVPSMH